MNTKTFTLTIIIIILFASIFGFYIYCSAQADNPPPEVLRVFMASSLINVVNNMTNEFNIQNNCIITLNSAGSNTLYQQITSGSRCDVFMAADSKWTKQLDNANLLSNGYQNFTNNKLEILVPKDNPKHIKSMLDLVKPGVKIVIAESTVPVGAYTNKTLTKIDATWGNQSSTLYRGPEWENYRSRFLANVVSYEVSVESVVGKVSLGLGTIDAGMAFVSDATYAEMSGAKLGAIEVPTEVNTVGTYGIAMIDGASQTNLAQKYVDFWLSSQGQTLLNDYGFGT
jgi:molybdate transport system substrate-binding protein